MNDRLVRKYILLTMNSHHERFTVNKNTLSINLVRMRTLRTGIQVCVYVITINNVIVTIIGSFRIFSSLMWFNLLVERDKVSYSKFDWFCGDNNEWQQVQKIVEKCIWKFSQDVKLVAMFRLYINWISCIHLFEYSDRQELRMMFMVLVNIESQLTTHSIKEQFYVS